MPLKPAIILFFICIFQQSDAQVNLLLNGGFDDINTCTEYSAECGVEGWFYLKDVKVQMLHNDTVNAMTGTNSIAILYNWNGYTGFTPIIGTLLPCGLQAGKQYTLRGLLNVKLNPKLNFKPGVCFGEFFYVPRRPFASNMVPDSLATITPLEGTNFVQLTFHFTATGNEKYLTLGSYVHKDSLAGKIPLTGVQTVSWIMDQFSLQPDDKEESYCDAREANKQAIYAYNFRHKEMDYSLYGKGKLAIDPVFEENSLTQRKTATSPPELKPDTLQLSDVLFDFNKADLKPAAIQLLADYFTAAQWQTIDSIRIEGHTDSIGSDQHNLELSKQRSLSVQHWLSSHGRPEMVPVSVYAFGRSRPLSSNKTPEGRARNRRVELILFRKTVIRQQ